MTDFLECCNRYAPLDKASADGLCLGLKAKTYKKGEYILREGEVCKYLYFLSKGLAKISFEKGDKEFIMRFFSGNVLFSVFESFITQAPSPYRIVALEETTVMLISHRRMEELCKKHHDVETLFRKVLSIVAIRMTKRISEMLEENATERYTQFVKEHHSILQRISLGDLASYLGITQQSLSRIRAKK